jgi:hypothetical protein
MGQKRETAEGSFVRETSAQAVEFYRDLVQNLKPWQAPAPKLHTEPDTADGAVETVVIPAWVGEEPATPSLDGRDNPKAIGPGSEARQVGFGDS